MKTILVIEDNLEVRENLVEILELSGYNVLSAENGKIGVKQAMDHIPDLILCDVMMPELDGFGVLKILNANPQLMHIPFMFLTAKAEKADFRKGMGLGADDYITKPFDDVELLESIEVRLRKSEKLGAVGNTDKGLRQFYDEAKADAKFKELSEGRELRNYTTKVEVYSAGQRPNWLYFVVSGQVKCASTNEIGKELITRIYGPGDFFGFTPLLTGNLYEEDAVIIEDAVLRLIPKEDFKLLLFNDRDFAAKFIKMLANHADYSERHLIDLAYSSVRKKVANAILLLQEKSADNIIHVKREDLANLAGTAKETVIRTVTELRKDGYIEIINGDISVVDQEGLKNIPQ